MLLWFVLALYCWYAVKSDRGAASWFWPVPPPAWPIRRSRLVLAIFVFLILERLWSWLHDRSGPGRLDLFRDLSLSDWVLPLSLE